MKWKLIILIAMLVILAGCSTPKAWLYYDHQWHLDEIPENSRCAWLWYDEYWHFVTTEYTEEETIIWNCFQHDFH